MNIEIKKKKQKPLPKIPEMTLCPPGAWPPERTTPIFKLLFSMEHALGSHSTSLADGCPNNFGNNFFIISAITSNEKIYNQY